MEYGYMYKDLIHGSYVMYIHTESYYLCTYRIVMSSWNVRHDIYKIPPHMSSCMVSPFISLPSHQRHA